MADDNRFMADDNRLMADNEQIGADDKRLGAEGARETARGRRAAWLFYAGVVVALLPVMMWRDFTPDNELRYLSIVDEALRNHDIFAFTNHGTAYADKPPLYFWYLMLCRVLAGGHCLWLAALGSLIPALATVGVMERWSRDLLKSDMRGAARLMLITSAYFLGAAVILRMDMLMCLFIVLALRTFWKLHEGNGKKRDRWLLPLYLFLALFTKGPLGILIPLAATSVFLALKGEIRQWTKYWGWRTWVPLLVLCGLWFWGVYADGGKEYLDNLLFHQTVDRAVDSFHHKRPFHYYLTAVWYIIAPWSLYVIGAIVADLRKPRELPALQQYFLTIGLTTLLLLSCISSKLQIYFLPGVPFLVYSAMISLPKYKDNILTKIALAFPAAVITLALPALAVASQLDKAADYMGWAVYAMGGILTAGGATALFLLFRRGAKEAIAAIGIAMLAAVFAGGFALRGLNGEMGYGAVCREAKKTAEAAGTDTYYTWGIRRAENMDVYLGKEVIILGEDSVPDTSALGKGLLLVKEKDSEKFGRYEVRKVTPYAIIVMR